MTTAAFPNPLRTGFAFPKALATGFKADKESAFLVRAPIPVMSEDKTAIFLLTIFLTSFAGVTLIIFFKSLLDLTPKAFCKVFVIPFFTLSASLKSYKFPEPFDIL